MLYLTPDGYRARGFGAEDMEDSDLRAILNRASRAVDSYCAVPTLPQRHSFRGGTITQEQHDYRIGNGVWEGVQRTIFLWHTPLLTVTQMRIHVTNTQYVNFDPADLFVSHNSVEIVSLAMSSHGLFGAAITPVLGLGVPKIRTNYTYGYQFSEVDEILEDTDAQAYRASNQFWDTTAVEVKVNGSVADPNDYTLDREEGLVIFDAGLAAGDVVTASYGYTLPGEIAEAVGWITTDMTAEKAMAVGGMTGLRSLKVGEISLERNVPRNSASAVMDDIPDRAARLLDGFRFISQ